MSGYGALHKPGNSQPSSLIGICLTLPNLGFFWVFFKYPKISQNGNPLFFPVGVFYEAIMLSRKHLKFKKSDLGRREDITSEGLLSKNF